MRRKVKLSKKVFGILFAVVGGIILIEAVPLFVWYILLGILFCGLIIFLII